MGKFLVFVFIVFFSVLVIVCFCVFGLVILMVLIVGVGKGVEFGIFIKNGEVFEIVRKVMVVFFDKIGMLIKGKFEVIDVIIFDVDEGEFLEFVVLVEKCFEYFLGEVIVRKVEEFGIEVEEFEEFEVVIGKGVRVKVCGKEVFVGNRRFMVENGIDFESVEEIF